MSSRCHRLMKDEEKREREGGPPQGGASIIWSLSLQPVADLATILLYYVHLVAKSSTAILQT
jgi:hypothetical protein